MAERIVVVGAGAIGGVLAARLHQSGTDVLVVARGDHGAAIAADGLTVHSPRDTTVVPLAVATDLAGADLRPSDVVVLAVKANDTAAALDQLVAAWPEPLPVVCAQNGTANEDAALRWTPAVYGAWLMFPATHLEPGLVRAHWDSPTGMLDLGPALGGLDHRAQALASRFSAAGFSSRAVPDIMRWKHFKLLMNLGNAVEALCGPEARGGRAAAILEAEGRAVLDAAAVPVASAAEVAERQAELADVHADGAAAGGSTWQSLARGRGVESGWLNGEVVLLGRRHLVPTPANELVLELVLTAARRGRPPGGLPEDELLTALQRAAVQER